MKSNMGKRFRTICHKSSFWEGREYLVKGKEYDVVEENGHFYLYEIDQPNKFDGIGSGFSTFFHTKEEMIQIRREEKLNKILDEG